MQTTIPRASCDSPISVGGLARAGQPVGKLPSVGPNAPSATALALHRLCRALCSAHCIKTQLVGQIPSGPKILVAHHHSQLDPVVVCSAIACTPVAKLDVRAWALVGSIAELCNTMFVRPDEAQSEAQVLTRIVRLLEQGASILAFPEGTAASRGGTLRLGVFDAARLLGLPVVPLSVRFAGSPMRWMGDDEFPPLELQPLDSTPRTVHVAVGPSLWSVDFPTSTDHARAAQTWLTRQGERARTRG